MTLLKLVFINLELCFTALLFVVLIYSSYRDVLRLNLLGRCLDNVFDEKLAIAKLADSSSLTLLLGLVVLLHSGVDPRLLRALLAVAEPAIGAVHHLSFVLEWLTA